jgi:hypothetical protein
MTVRAFKAGAEDFPTKPVLGGDAACRDPAGGSAVSEPGGAARPTERAGCALGKADAPRGRGLRTGGTGQDEQRDCL